MRSTLRLGGPRASSSVGLRLKFEPFLQQRSLASVTPLATHSLSRIGTPHGINTTLTWRLGYQEIGLPRRSAHDRRSLSTQWLRSIAQLSAPSTLWIQTPPQRSLPGLQPRWTVSGAFQQARHLSGTAARTDSEQSNIGKTGKETSRYET